MSQPELPFPPGSSVIERYRATLPRLHEGILPVGWEKGKVYAEEEIEELLKNLQNPQSEFSELDALFEPSRMIGDDHNLAFILSEQHAKLAMEGIERTDEIASLVTLLATYADILRQHGRIDQTVEFVHENRVYTMEQEEVDLPDLKQVLVYPLEKKRTSLIKVIGVNETTGKPMKISFIPESIPLIETMGFFMGPNIKTDALLDDVNPYHLNPVRLLILFPHLTNHGEQGPKA
jgi:hypothetical protein